MLQHRRGVPAPGDRPLEQSIAQRRETVEASRLTHDVVDRRIATDLENYRRYRVTEDGVSPISVPGMKGGEYQTNGLEHDEQDVRARCTRCTRP
jgi:pyruvate/2-oxoacid:ferredoxin oxidoreductase alpha subunit